MRDLGILKRPSQLTQEPGVQLLPPKLFLGSLLRKCMEPKNQVVPLSGVLQTSFHPDSHFAIGSVGVSVVTVTSDPGSGLPLQLHCQLDTAAPHLCAPPMHGRQWPRFLTAPRAPGPPTTSGPDV